MKCKNCNEKEAVKYSKYSNGLFCSKECARSFSTKSKRKQINEKVSKKLEGTGNGDVTNKCKMCGKEFTVVYYRRNQEFCSKTCGSQYSNSQPEKKNKLSKARVKSIKNGIINGAGKKSTYIFKGKEINCDSKIENACINYFEKLGADKIRRSNIEIIYYDHDNHKRRFLPDFEITLNNEEYLVEAKGYVNMKTLDEKWRDYNKISDIKKKVLIEYCEENGLKPFWFEKKLNRKYYDNMIG